MVLLLLFPLIILSFISDFHISFTTENIKIMSTYQFTEYQAFTLCISYFSLIKKFSIAYYIIFPCILFPKFNPLNSYHTRANYVSNTKLYFLSLKPILILIFF